MKIKVLLMLLVFTGTGLIAQDFAYSEHLMQKFNSAQQRAAQKNSSSTDYLWLTPLLNEARQNKEKWFYVNSCGNQIKK